LLERALREPIIVEGAKFLGPPAQHPDERERRGNSVEKESEPLRELRHVLGLTLDLIERMAQREENGAESAAGICSKCPGTVLFRQLKGTTRRLDPLFEGACPWDQDRKEEIGPSPKVIQPAPFEQIAGDLSEPITLIVVAESSAGDQSHRPLVH